MAGSKFMSYTLFSSEISEFIPCRNYEPGVLKNEYSSFAFLLAIGNLQNITKEKIEKETKAKLGAKAIGRREFANNAGYELKDAQPVGPYLEAKPKVVTTAFLHLKSAA